MNKRITTHRGRAIIKWSCTDKFPDISTPSRQAVSLQFRMINIPDAVTLTRADDDSGVSPSCRSTESRDLLQWAVGMQERRRPGLESSKSSKRLRSKRRAVNDDTAPFVVGGRLTGGTMRVRGQAPVRAGDGAAPSCTLKTPTTTDDDQSSSFSRDPDSDRRHRVSTRFVHLCCSLG